MGPLCRTARAIPPLAPGRIWQVREREEGDLCVSGVCLGQCFPSNYWCDAHVGII